MKSITKARSKNTGITAAIHINEAHRAAMGAAATAMMTGIERAIEVGRLLAAEKEKHGHGEWIPWIEENLEFGRKQAAAYMRGYELRDGLKEKLSNVTTPVTFGLERAIKLLAKPREKPVKKRESLPASVEVSDSDENYDDDQRDIADADDDSGEDGSNADGYLGAYLIRADQAARFAFYKGPFSNEVVAMARRVADAWTKLAERVEEKR